MNINQTSLEHSTNVFDLDFKFRVILVIFTKSPLFNFDKYSSLEYVFGLRNIILFS